MIWVIACLWLAGVVLLWKVPLCRAGSDRPDPRPLSVIIPARDEEANIGRLLESIRAQSHQPCEVIVVDDGSRDRTAGISAEAGAKVTAAPPPPGGWRGKTWSCRHGAAAAEGGILLFLDADTVLKPGAIRRMMTVMNTNGLAALSLAPYHEVRRPYEQFSAMFNLMTAAGIGAFSLFGSPSRPAGFFGPVMMITRDAYDAVGGHEPVKGEILEHMAMGRLLREKGDAVLCLGGRGTVHTRMYPDGWGSMVEGWTKAFAAGASGSGRAELILSVAWMTGGMLAWIMAVVAAVTPLAFAPYGMLYAVYALQTHGMLRRVGSFSPLASAFYPALLLFFFAVFAGSALRRRRGGTVRWKGREINAGEGGRR